MADAARVALRRPRGPMFPLVVGRIIDQSALGIASLLLARALGPQAFAPVAVLFTVNSLAVQMSDFGLGFAVYKVAPGDQLALRSLTRVRSVDAGICGLTILVGALLGDVVGIVVAASGALWWLSMEAYVRKAAALKRRAVAQVVRAEIIGAAVFGVGVCLILVSTASGLWLIAPLLLKHLVEVLTVRSWQDVFSSQGRAARSGAEWLSQVMTYLVANVDYVVVGWLLGAEAFSVYVVAFRLASVLPAFIATPITQTAFLELAATTDAPHRRQTVYDRILRRTGLLGGVGTLGLLVGAPLLPLMLGPEWKEGAAILALLASAVTWRLLLGTTVAQVIIAGRARLLVAAEGARLVVSGAVVAVATLGGLATTAAAVSIVTILTITVEHNWAGRLSGVRTSRALTAAAVVVAAVVVVGLSVA